MKALRASLVLFLFVESAISDPIHDPRAPRADQEQMPFQKSAKGNPGIPLRFRHGNSFGECGGTVVDMANLKNAGDIAQKLNFPLAGLALRGLSLVKQCYILTAGHCVEDDLRRGKNTGVVNFQTPYGIGEVKATFVVHPKFAAKPKGTLTDDIAIIFPPKDFCESLKEQNAPRDQVCISPLKGDEHLIQSNRKNASAIVHVRDGKSEKDVFTTAVAETNVKVPHGINLGDSGGFFGDKLKNQKFCWRGAISNKPAPPGGQGTEYSTHMGITGPRDWLWVWGQLLKKTAAGIFARN